MNEHKEEIISTRKGCLGSSDGKLLQQVALHGCVPKSAYKRLAICKGLIEQEEIPYTDAVRTGDEIEMALFEHMKATNPLCESNPLVVSEKYSRKNVRLIDHPDIRIQDNEKRVLTYVECKASKYPTEEVRRTYKPQLFIHTMMATEEAQRLGKDWKVRVLLAHFNTEGLDLSQGCEFDPNRLTIKQVRVERTYYDLVKTMDMVDTFIERMDFYAENEVIDAELLPTEVQTQFKDVAKFLREIKEREDKIDAFKTKLYNFFTEKGISKVICDDFSFTVVAPTQQVAFDYKEYLLDMEAHHPRVARKVRDKYKKVINKSGYVKICVK